MGIKNKELWAMTDEELRVKITKMEKIIATHPQKTQVGSAASTKKVCVNELIRRFTNEQANGC